MLGFYFQLSQNKVPRTATRLVLKIKNQRAMYSLLHRKKKSSRFHLGGVDEMGFPNSREKSVSNPSDQVLPSTKLLGTKLGHTAVMAWVQ